MQRGLECYVRPIVWEHLVMVELGFAASGEETPEEGENIGGTTPDYDYEDDTWD